jgi:hypothetical protein
MNCEQVRDLLECYALGALDPDERASVEAHLAGCRDCRTLASEYAGIAAVLPEALAARSPVQLPAGLQARIWQSVQPNTSEPAAQPALAPASRWPYRGTPARPAPAWLSVRLIGGVVTIALLLAALVAAFQLNTALAQERALRAEYANLVGQQETVLEVIDSNKTVKALLRATNPGSPAYGKLYTRPDLPNVVVMAARLDPPPPGQAYRLWLVQDGQTLSPGDLTINSQGFGLIVFDAAQNGPIYQKAKLVLQPAAQTAPEGPVILSWDSGR